MPDLEVKQRRSESDFVNPFVVRIIRPSAEAAKLVSIRAIEFPLNVAIRATFTTSRRRRNARSAAGAFFFAPVVECLEVYIREGPRPERLVEPHAWLTKPQQQEAGNAKQQHVNGE